jgi:tetratricopeptide (TPR) repeat protein
LQAASAEFDAQDAGSDKPLISDMRDAEIHAAIARIEALKLTAEANPKDVASSEGALSLAALASAWFNLAELTGDPSLFEIAIAEYRRAHTAIAAFGDASATARALLTLAYALLTHGQTSNDCGALTEAIDTYRLGLAALPATADKTIRMQAEVDLGQTLHLLGTRRSIIGVLHDAIAAYGAALKSAGSDADPAQKARIYRHLGLSWRNLGKITRDRAHLETALSAYIQAESLLLHHGYRIDGAAAKVEQGLTLFLMAEIARLPGAAHAALQCHMDAAIILDGETGSSLWIDNCIGFGDAYLALTAQSGDPVEARAAANAYESALQWIDPDQDEHLWVQVRMNFGSALRYHGELAPCVESLARAAEVYRRTLLRIPRSRLVDRARLQSNLGNALRIRGELLGRIMDIKAAINAYRSALPVLAKLSLWPSWATTQMNLGTAWLRLGEMNGDVKQLRQAVAADMRAIRIWLADTYPVEHAICSINLGTALARLGEHLHSDRLLRRAVLAFDLAISVLAPVRAADHARAELGRGNALLKLAETKADPDLAREAVAALRRVLDLPAIAVSSADRSRASMNLGIAMLGLAESTGDQGLLHEAIAACREAVNLRRGGNLGFRSATASAQLASTFIRLAETTRDGKFARQAIDVSYEATLDIRRRAHPIDWAIAKIHLGVALRTYGGIMADVRALRRAIKMFRETRAGLRNHHHHEAWFSVCLNESVTLITLASLTRNPADALAAISVATEAETAAARQGSEINLAATLAHQSNNLTLLSELDADADRARDAVLMARRALAVLPMARRPVEWSRVGFTLGRALRTLCALTGLEEDWDALTAHETAYISLIEQLAWSAPSVTEQIAWCERAAGSANRLTEALILRGRTAEALSAAQSGMAIQLTFGLHISDQSVVVRQARVAWQEACHEAEKIDRNLLQRSKGESAADRRNMARRLVEARFDLFRHTIEDSGLKVPAPLRAKQIGAALPRSAAFVLLVPAQNHMSAIIIAAKDVDPSNTPRQLVIEEFGQRQLNAVLGDPRDENARQSASGSWFSAYGRFRSSLKPGGQASESDIAKWNRTIEGVLEKLWARLMKPLDAFLRNQMGLPPGAEIVLSVAGAASLLPLHAARRREGRRWRYFLEDWTISHAPSPASWLATRRRVTEPERSGRRLLAISAGPRQNPALPAFRAEEIEELSGKTAVPSRIIPSLSRANYLSFYCHGQWNPLNPALSALLTTATWFAGGSKPDSAELNVADFRSADLRRSRLACLWACESAMIGLRSSFEATGFPSALIDAGIPGVVAALWIVEDDATRHLASHMLREHLENGLSPAAALRAAQLEMLRNKKPDPKSSRIGLAKTAGAIGISNETPTFMEPSPVLCRVVPFYWAAFIMIGA